MTHRSPSELENGILGSTLTRGKELLSTGEYVKVLSKVTPPPEEEELEELEGVEFPQELTLALDLFQEQKRRAAKAWVRAYLDSKAECEEKEYFVSLLPPYLQEVAQKAPCTTQKLKAQRRYIPRWFVWGILCAALLNMTGQIAFATLKYKKRQAQMAGIQKPTPTKVRKELDSLMLSYQKAKFYCTEGLHQEGVKLLQKAVDRGIREKAMRYLFAQQIQKCRKASKKSLKKNHPPIAQ